MYQYLPCDIHSLATPSSIFAPSLLTPYPTLPPSYPLSLSFFSLSLSLSPSFPQECGVSKKEWTAKVKSTLKSRYNIEYEKVTGQTLWGIRIMLFVKPEHSKKITHLQCTQVRTGIGNVAGE